LNPSFQRRWFVLRGLCMTYYKTQQDSAAQGSIQLSSASLQVVSRFEFTLSVNTGRDFVLSSSLEKVLSGSLSLSFFLCLSVSLVLF
jgi:hypothetical protein